MPSTTGSASVKEDAASTPYQGAMRRASSAWLIDSTRA
jgi:hypothetical protein